jgi:hypothetical protein
MPRGIPYKNTGLGTTANQTPVAVKLPPHIDEIVKALPNRSNFIREAIREKLIRDGLLPDNQ